MIRVGDFRPSLHGFSFSNCWHNCPPMIDLATPFGRIGIGDASAGLCGGMVFAAIDAYLAGKPLPDEPDTAWFRYLVRRLWDSWDVPFGGVRYCDWQTRADHSTPGVWQKWVRPGPQRLTLRQEWPRVRRQLDRGRLAPLGVITVESYDLRLVGRNHQILAYGYSVENDAVTLRIYDPNYPNEDDLSLSMSLRGVDLGHPRFLTHGIEGPSYRGFFLTRYRPSRYRLPST